jgi:hypothetical protein
MTKHEDGPVTTPADYGANAMRVGTPDYAANYAEAITNAVDTIANIFHAIAHEEPDYEEVFYAALERFKAEIT